MPESTGSLHYARRCYRPSGVTNGGAEGASCHRAQQARGPGQNSLYLSLTNTKVSMIKFAELSQSPKVAHRNRLLLTWLPSCLDISYPTAQHFTVWSQRGGEGVLGTLHRASNVGRKSWIRSQLRPGYIVKQLPKQLLNKQKA